jgi:F-type H+-transporting ATPase subunit b
MIELNYTVLFQVVGFFVLLFILNRFLYTPLLKVMKEREERTGGTLKKASELEREVEEGLASYERKIKDATVKGYEEINKLRQEALAKEKAMVEASRNEMAGVLSDMRVKIDASKAGALAALKEETKTLSKSIAEKILEKKLAVILLTFMLMPALVYAAKEGEEGGGGAELIYKLINFVVMAVGAYIVWKKAIKGLLAKRGDSIKKALEDAKNAREAADAKAAEYRQKLSLLEKRIEELHLELRAEGEAEKSRILREAEEAVNKIKVQAKFASEQELKKAKMEIKKEVAVLAVALAEELLKKELTPADQEKLIKGYLENLKLTA